MSLNASLPADASTILSELNALIREERAAINALETAVSALGGVITSDTDLDMGAGTTYITNDVDLGDQALEVVNLSADGACNLAEIRGGRAGQIKIFRCTDGNVTFVNSATNIVLNRTGNLTSADGVILSLINSGGDPTTNVDGTWYEMACSEVLVDDGTMVTTFAKTLLDDANATAALATLGLTVSTFIKTVLDDTSASDALTTLGVSAFVKTLLDDADAAAIMTTLGITASISNINAQIASLVASAVSQADLTKLHAVTIAAADLNTLPIGYLQRARFTWGDADTITIGPGVYDHRGTTNQIVYWNSTLTFDSTDTGSQWYYLYLDDSAIVTHGSPLLTASEFINSTTAPTWSDEKHGWYNGNDRCIFAYFVSVGSIVSFTHDGSDYFMFRVIFDGVDISDISTTTAATIAVPDIAPDAQVLILVDADGSVPSGTRVTASGHVAVVAVASTTTMASTRVSTDSSQQTSINATSYTGKTDIAIYMQGWYFPRGM